jgi:hypothetical protein
MTTAASARAGNDGRDERVAAIAHDYLEAGVTVRAILKRHDLSSGRFYELVREQGWTLRRPAKPGERGAATVNDKQAALIARMRKLAGRHLAALEAISGDGEAGLAGHERFAKALSALLGLVTRIDELEAARRAGDATTNRAMTTEEADERRQKLAQVLVAMLEQASGQRLPEHA